MSAIADGNTWPEPESKKRWTAADVGGCIAVTALFAAFFGSIFFLIDMGNGEPAEPETVAIIGRNYEPAWEEEYTYRYKVNGFWHSKKKVRQHEAVYTLWLSVGNDARKMKVSRNLYRLLEKSDTAQLWKTRGWITGIIYPDGPLTAAPSNVPIESAKAD